MNKFNSVLFFGRQNCIYSEKLKVFIKSKTKKFHYIESKEKGENIDIKKVLK